MPPKDIVVLGGGITGLSSAFHLSRRFPLSHIHLLEKSQRHGGWIHSRRVKVNFEGRTADVCLESGPRTLRPNSSGVLELINLLGLQPSLITTPRTAPAARNRFLHIPGTQGLVALPSSLAAVFSSPLGPLLLKSSLSELIRRKNRPTDLQDESVDDFLTRRFGEEMARTLGSAVVHGIYAADSRELSVRTAFPSLWNIEERGWGGVVRGAMIPSRTLNESVQVAKEVGSTYDIGDVSQLMKDTSVFSFVDGMSTLTMALRNHLHRKAPNVSVRSGTEAVALNINHFSNHLEVRTKEGQMIPATHLVSTLPLPALQSILPSPPSSAPTSSLNPYYLPHLTDSPRSSVAVINIIFPTTNQPIHPDGFGYLIPRSRKGYGRGFGTDDDETTGILGTVFDSCSLAAQDKGDAGFTKLTVMLGGPYAPYLTPAHLEPSRVLKHLCRHLAVDSLPEPVHFEVTKQVNCIPIPTPGHLLRIQELRDALKREPWSGRMEVVGASVGGVSVGDCVEAGRQVGKDWI